MIPESEVLVRAVQPHNCRKRRRKEGGYFYPTVLSPCFCFSLRLVRWLDGWLDGWLVGWVGLRVGEYAWHEGCKMICLFIWNDIKYIHYNYCYWAMVDERMLSEGWWGRGKGKQAMVWAWSNNECEGRGIDGGWWMIWEMYVSLMRLAMGWWYQTA